MARPRPRPRLLLLLPSTTYRAAAFVAAAQRLDVDLTVGSDHTSTLAAANPDRLLRLSLDEPELAARQAAAFHARHPVSALFAVDDDTVVAASHVAAALGLRYNSIAASFAARDKHRQRQRLERAGVPIPGWAVHRFDGDLAALARGTRYPCVVKPTRLAMSRGVMRADTPGELLARLERLSRILGAPDAARACGDAVGEFLLEEFVPGVELAVEGLLRDGALRVLALFDKPDPLDGPFFEETIYVTPSRQPGGTQNAIAALVEQAARALGLERGPLHAEVRLGPSGPVLIELAARPIGGRCSAVLRFGAQGTVSLEELLLRAALGMPLAEEELTRESAAAAVMMIPTGGAGVLRVVEGMDEARLVPWVDDVVITAHPGQELVPLPEGSRYLGFIYAFAPEAADAELAVREAHARLRIRIA